MDKNMILHLPFDDPDGSIAYDFSQYRNDATLSDGADFSKKSKVGKSLALNGTGECETARSIPFSGNFTLLFLGAACFSKVRLGAEYARYRQL